MTSDMYENGKKALLGLIWGDIIGSYYEFLPPSQVKYKSVEELHKLGNVFQLPFGYYTDDTALTLASMQAFINSKGEFDPDSHMAETAAYYREGRYSPTGKCFDIGYSTVNAIARWENNEIKPWGRGGGGNGFLMRILPYVMYLVKSKRGMNDITIMSSLTHDDEKAKTCAGMYGCSLACALISGDPHLQGMSEIFNPHSDGVDASGYAVGTYNIVASTLKKDLGLMGGIEHIIKHGYDTDTNAAIYGMIAGIVYGVDEVEIKSIINIDNILSLYHEFYQCLKTT